MILQELHHYYERLLDDPDCAVAPAHWSIEKVAWELRLATDGRLVAVLPLNTDADKGSQASIPLCVPEHEGRSGTAIRPFFLCDNAAYLLGLDEKRGDEKRDGARQLHQEILADCNDEAARAVLAFFERADALDDLDDDKKEALAAGGFATFRLAGDTQRVHDRPRIKEAWHIHHSHASADAVEGQCAVTGERAALARLFPQVTGIPGAQSAGASLVSFNKDAFNSYGKDQAYNASLSEKVAFNAGSALRHLFADPSHQVRLGDTTVVFWTDRPAPREEETIGLFLGLEPDRRSENDLDRQRIQQTLDLIRKGKPLEGSDPETRFFILGIAPNAARLAVRFFEVSTFGKLMERYRDYLRDVEMVGVRQQSLWMLLRQTAPLGKADSVPSTLISNCWHAMLNGTRFPQALLQLLISRMRTDHASNNSWDMGQRAALMKACLVRDERISARTQGRDNYEGSIQVTLRENNTDQGYILGRLFAVMDQTQSAALKDVNATIKDRFIGSAAATPALVFPSLLRNHQNHMAKLRKNSPGLCTKFEKEMDAITALFDKEPFFPATLNAAEQGNFYIGYYQERESLWTRKPDEERDTAETEITGISQ
ncbi:MAG: type I-C CRISPR-associated protein Cas8c/Csd1 [Adlercreutzia sp.]|nr:type I-C CRISPR-associated protein Cas8c/Csd1 [Adlercreutzia sp.]